jgi:hypothetical protein
VRRLGGPITARDGTRLAPLRRAVDGRHLAHLEAKLAYVDAPLADPGT